MLVLFVLLTASVLGLLMLQYTKSMFESTIDVYQYNRAYYLGQAGLEAGLAGTATQQIGYENTYQADQTVRDCNPIDCESTGDIVARAAMIGNTADDIDSCTDEHAFYLSGGESVAFPLFYDDGSGGRSRAAKHNTSITIDQLAG
jgi:Tfp pilus assembly protein PilV